MTDSIQKLIEQYKVREAFWAAADDVENNRENQIHFLQILGFNNNVAALRADSDKIKEQAEHGDNPYMAYAYARLHDVLQYENNSNDIKKMYYNIAADHDIGDAYAYLAYMYKDGDYGEHYMDVYETLMQEAAERGSEKALQQTIRNQIYGCLGYEANPSKAYTLAEDHLKELDFTNPAYYMLMAEADMQLGRKANAICNFEASATHGCSAAFYWWAITECFDDDYNIVDRQRFLELRQKGTDVSASECFMMYPLLVEEEDYETLEESDKAEVTKDILNDLEAGWMLGNSECPFFLGNYFENGLFGFEQNFDYAWMWYCRGAILRSAACFESLARMILEEGTAPPSFDEEDGYECAYKGLLLGSDDMLEVVIDGYKNGFLSIHSAIIESKWLPEYEQKIDEMMDDHEIDGDEYDDSHEYLYDGEPEREIEED